MDDFLVSIYVIEEKEAIRIANIDLSMCGSEIVTICIDSKLTIRKTETAIGEFLFEME